MSNCFAVSLKILLPSTKTGLFMDGSPKLNISSMKIGFFMDGQSQLLSEIDSDRSQPKSGNDGSPKTDVSSTKTGENMDDQPENDVDQPSKYF